MKAALRLLGSFALAGVVAGDASAASYTLTWLQDAALVAENTRVERSNATGRSCGVFAEIAIVSPTTLTYQDVTAPTGIVCYRARNFDSLTGFSEYSNIAAAPRTAPPKNLQTP